MKSGQLGTSTSAAEVTNISPQGIWLLVEAREYFLPFQKFPWFKQATVAAILQVEYSKPGHLHWPEIDVDLCLESIVDPDKFPLVSRSGG